MTPEERIKAAAEALKPLVMAQDVEDAVKQVLTAAYPEDFPPNPKWPSDESVIELSAALGSRPGEASFERLRERLRLAFLADPIVKAAMKCRDEWKKGDGWRNKYPEVVRAIDEAGL